MVENPDRSWIGKPQPPTEYANGTRLFAYRALRGQLTCPQLTSALDEIRRAGRTFSTQLPGVSPGQAKRLLTLNADVERELQTEFSARCKS